MSAQQKKQALHLEQNVCPKCGAAGEQLVDGGWSMDIPGHRFHHYECSACGCEWDDRLDVTTHYAGKEIDDVLYQGPDLVRKLIIGNAAEESFSIVEELAGAKGAFELLSLIHI